MKSKRKIFLAATVVIMAAIFFGMRSLASWRPQLMVRAPGYYLLAVSPEENWVLLGRENAGAMRVWNRSSGKMRDLEVMSPQIPLFGDENRLLLPQFEGKRLIEVLNLETGKTERVLGDLKAPTDNALEDWNVSADEAQVRVLTTKSLRVWNWKTGVLTRNYALDKIFAGRLNFEQLQLSPDGHMIAMIGADLEISLWNAQNGQREGTFGASAANVWFTQNPRVLGSYEANEMVYRHLPDGKILWKSDAPIPFDLSSQKFVSISTTKGLELRDLETGKLVQLRPEITENETAVLSRDGNWIWTSNPKGEVRRWRIR